MEEDIEPNEAAAKAAYGFYYISPYYAGILGQFWEDISEDQRNHWRTLVALAHAAYHDAYDRRAAL